MVIEIFNNFKPSDASRTAIFPMLSAAVASGSDACLPGYFKITQQQAQIDKYDPTWPVPFGTQLQGPIQTDIGSIGSS